MLRDYARLGRLLAYDGAWDGRQIIPVQWMMDATTVRASDVHLQPGKAMRDFGYGYLLWLLPGSRRQFALVGDLGQRICIDPASKLVMVQTGLETRAEVWRLWSDGGRAVWIRGRVWSSFRGDAKHRTRNLEIPGLVLRTIPE